MPPFTELVTSYLAESFALDPLEATNAGVHDHDGRWPDWSSRGLDERQAFVDRWTARLEAWAPEDLSADEAIDRDRLRLELGDRGYERRFAEDTWNPLLWVYRLGDGLFTLISREFAPPADRLASLSGRLEGIESVVAAARERLGSGEHPVARLHTDIALLNFGGIEDLVAEGLALADSSASDPGVAAVRPRLDAAAAEARTALAELHRHLRRVVLPKSEGEGLLGQERFAERLQHTFSDPAMTPERVLAAVPLAADQVFDVLAAAEAQYVLVRAEIVRLCRDLWRTWCPDRALPASEAEIVRGVIDAVSLDHPTHGVARRS